jgi:hypothetical protein
VIEVTNKEDYFIFQIDLKKLDSILNKIYSEYSSGTIKIEVAPFTSGIRMRDRTMNKFLADFKLDEDKFGELIREIVFFTKALIMDEEETIFEKYGKPEETKRIVDLFRQWFLKFPNMINDIQFKSFCKTQYLENLTWEISTKVIQDGGITMNLPVFLVRMSFLKPSSSMACPLNMEDTVTFECTLHGIRNMIKSLKEAEHALEELEERRGVNA